MPDLRALRAVSRPSFQRPTHDAAFRQTHVVTCKVLHALVMGSKFSSRTAAEDNRVGVFMLWNKVRGDAWRHHL
ncbi:hypothetical protein CGLAMM_10235 [Acetobacteraceae bacterium EV16G]|uniref:Uncharacterized protein n=2 Tax=Sorlinia euscelidii TaxID=3081148 RepID=A0ABU7TZZ3_9PROT